MKHFIIDILFFLIISWLPVSAQLYEYRKLDLNTLISNQSVSVQVNSSFDFGKLTNIFDGDSITLARSSGINPLVITLSFADSI
ncbi:MAG: hypothetical protein HZB41_00290 [Ignavibacteriae bacterium]|nr:hypothetical protein [Ignavibacteriota bacterium]